MSEAQSGNTPAPSRPPRMSLVAERQVPDPPTAPIASFPSTPTPKPPDLRPHGIHGEFITRTAWKQGVIGSLNVAAMILGARFILLVATVGALGLSYLAVQQAAPLQLGAVGLYLAGVVLPLTWLASRH